MLLVRMSACKWRRESIAENRDIKSNSNQIKICLKKKKKKVRWWSGVAECFSTVNLAYSRPLWERFHCLIFNCPSRGCGCLWGISKRGPHPSPTHTTFTSTFLCGCGGCSRWIDAFWLLLSFFFYQFISWPPFSLTFQRNPSSSVLAVST